MNETLKLKEGCPKCGGVMTMNDNEERLTVENPDEPGIFHCNCTNTIEQSQDEEDWSWWEEDCAWCE